MAERPGGEHGVRETAVAPPSDEDLASRLQAGYQSAFEVLVRRHHKRVRSLCYRMLGSANEAEDLAQETFLRVYRHRETYQAGRRFRTWLDRICMNVCLTHQERVRAQGPIVRLGDQAAQV